MNPDTPAGRRILLVEDNEAAREDWAGALRRCGYAAAAAADGQEALSLLGGGLEPDLIVLDMLTPGVDGWRFLERRKQDPALSAVPVVITTGLGVACAEWAAALGAAGYLRKPLDGGDLGGEVRRCLAGGEGPSHAVRVRRGGGPVDNARGAGRPLVHVVDDEPAVRDVLSYGDHTDIRTGQDPGGVPDVRVF